MRPLLGGRIRRRFSGRRGGVCDVMCEGGGGGGGCLCLGVERGFISYI